MNDMPQPQLTGMTFDPNNANVKALQARYPQNWMEVMGQSQGMPPVLSFAQQNAHMFNGDAQAAQARLDELNNGGFFDTKSAYAFGALVAQAVEKDAGVADGVKSMLGNVANYAVNRALPAAKSLVSRGVERAKPVAAAVAERAKPVGAAVAKGFNKVDDAVGNRISGAGQAVANKAVQGAKLVGSVGQVSQDAVRHGLNYADDAARYAMNGPGRAAATGGKLGDRIVRPVQTEAGRMFGTSPVGDKLNPLNVATGAGAMYGAGRATGLVGGGGAEPTAQTIENQQASTQAMAQQQGEANPNAAAANGGLMGMWNSLPTEARYAIGAGVPLALAGAFMGGRGNYGLGGAMGALGLGAAGLGAAGAGMFGDGPRRMVGQGANALYNMVGGGQGGNPMDQINALGRLSPEFGTTMLMGRDPNMNSEQGRQMYDFLTHNKNIIEQLMPQLQNASVTGVKQSSALEFGMKVARCWKGYEPVPGKKPYSNDSCRPVGSKKKKEKKAVSSAPRGKTEMSCTPSSRGSSKPIDDKQRGAVSPVPTDATNAQQQYGVNEKTSAPNLAAFGGMVGRGISAGARGLVGGAGKLMSGAGKAVARGGDALAQNSVKMIDNTAPFGMKHVAGAAGTLAGGAAGAAGRVGQLAGKGLQAAGQHAATAVPVAGAAAYYGAGAPQFQSPVQFRSPIVPR